jgi:hypothetical protein
MQPDYSRPIPLRKKPWFALRAFRKTAQRGP